MTQCLRTLVAYVYTHTGKVLIHIKRQIKVCVYVCWCVCVRVCMLGCVLVWVYVLLGREWLVCVCLVYCVGV